MSDKPVQQPQGAMAPAKAISRWADTVNWILLNATPLHIPNHLRETLQEECLRIRAAVAREHPPAGPSVAPEQQPPRRMQANPAEPTDTYHAQEHNEIKECQAGRPCEPVDPLAAKPRRWMEGNADCPDRVHGVPHTERATCDANPRCEPVDPPAPTGPAPTASAEELYNALRRSLRLQRHYAELLNMNDGGQRRLDVFASPEAWIARLRETGDLPSAPEPKESAP